jgi:hypothetical protein
MLSHLDAAKADGCAGDHSLVLLLPTAASNLRVHPLSLPQRGPVLPVCRVGTICRRLVEGKKLMGAKGTPEALTSFYCSTISGQMTATQRMAPCLAPTHSHPNDAPIFLLSKADSRANNRTLKHLVVVRQLIVSFGWQMWIPPLPHPLSCEWGLLPQRQSLISTQQSE